MALGLFSIFPKRRRCNNMEENENTQNNQYYEASNSQNYYQAQAEPRPVVTRKPHAGNPVVALTLGILSLFAASTGIGAFAGIVLAIIGILQGNWARKADRNDGMAQAGLILSIIGLVACAVFFIFGLALFGMTFSILEDVFHMARYGMYYW